MSALRAHKLNKPFNRCQSNEMVWAQRKISLFVVARRAFCQLTKVNFWFFAFWHFIEIRSNTFRWQPQIEFYIFRLICILKFRRCRRHGRVDCALIHSQIVAGRMKHIRQTFWQDDESRTVNSLIVLRCWHFCAVVVSIEKSLSNGKIISIFAKSKMTWVNTPFIDHLQQQTLPSIVLNFSSRFHFIFAFSSFDNRISWICFLFLQLLWPKVTNRIFFLLLLCRECAFCVCVGIIKSHFECLIRRTDHRFQIDLMNDFGKFTFRRQTDKKKTKNEWRRT